MITFLQAAEVAATEEARMGLWELFTKGGWLMWPLLILGGVTIFIFVERFLAIRKASTLDMNFMNRIRDFILDGKIAAAVDLCRKTDTPIARMIEKGIERLGRHDERRAVGHRECGQSRSVETRKRTALAGDDRRRRADDRFSGYGARYGADLHGYVGGGRYGRHVAAGAVCTWRW